MVFVVSLTAAIIIGGALRAVIALLWRRERRAMAVGAGLLGAVCVFLLYVFADDTAWGPARMMAVANALAFGFVLAPLDRLGVGGERA